MSENMVYLLFRVLLHNLLRDTPSLGHGLVHRNKFFVRSENKDFICVTGIKSSSSEAPQEKKSL